MKQKDQHKDPAATGTPPPKRRFRIEKLEERVAPTKGGNGTKNCSGSLATGRTC